MIISTPFIVYNLNDKATIKVIGFLMLVPMGVVLSTVHMKIFSIVSFISAKYFEKVIEGWIFGLSLMPTLRVSIVYIFAPHFNETWSNILFFEVAGFVELLCLMSFLYYLSKVKQTSSIPNAQPLLD